MLRRETARLHREQQHVTPEIGAADASMSAEWHDFLDTLRDIVSSDEFWTLILHYHFDYSYGEIADLLDKEANAVRQIAHRGRRKCREHLTRLEGRVPAWVMLPDAGPESGGRVAESSDGDPPGLREPRMPDPADRSRRPSVGSDSAQAVPPSPPDLPPAQQPAPQPASARASASSWRRRPRLRPDGPGRLFGNPTTVVPLTLVIALPLLFQVDRALDATVARPAIRTAQLVDDPGGPPPSGPTISVSTSTAPTDQREAPSTSAPPPDSSDPPTTALSSTTLASTTAVPSSTTGSTVPSTTVPATTAPTTPTTVRPTTTQRPTTQASTTSTTRASTTSTTPTTRASSTSAAPTSASTSQPTTSTSTTTTSTTTTRSTTTTSAATSSTSSSSTSTTAPSTTTTTSGRDPGNGGDPPPNQ